MKQKVKDNKVVGSCECCGNYVYDEENEYYVSPGDFQELIEPYMDEKEYDYIYVAIRTGDLNKSDEVLVHDWIGLRSNGI